LERIRLTQKLGCYSKPSFWGTNKGLNDETLIDPLDYCRDCIARDRLRGTDPRHLCNRKWPDCSARYGGYPGVYQCHPAPYLGVSILRIHSVDPGAVHAGNQCLHSVALLANRCTRVWSRLFRARFLAGVLGRVGGQHCIFRLVDVLERVRVKILYVVIRKTSQQLY
jgi:hypothetical protein